MALDAVREEYEDKSLSEIKTEITELRAEVKDQLRLFNSDKPDKLHRKELRKVKAQLRELEDDVQRAEANETKSFINQDLVKNKKGALGEEIKRIKDTMTNAVIDDPEGDTGYRGSLKNKEQKVINVQNTLNRKLQDYLATYTVGKISRLQYEELLNIKDYLDNEDYRDGPYVIQDQSMYRNLLALFPELGTVIVYSPTSQNRKEERLKRREERRKQRDVRNNTRSSTNNNTTKNYNNASTKTADRCDTNCNTREAHGGTINGFLDKGILDLQRSGHLDAKGAKVLHSVKGIANTALAIASIWKIAKGARGVVFGDDKKSKAGRENIKTGLMLGGGYMALNYVNISRIRHSISEWTGLSGMKYSDISEPLKPTAELGVVKNGLSGIPFSSLLASGALSFDRNGKVISIDENKILPYANETQKTNLQNLINWEKESGKNITEDIFAKLNLNKETLSSNPNASIDPYAVNYNKDPEQEKKGLLQKQVEREKELNKGSLSPTKKAELMNAATKMYENGDYNVSFEVVGNQVFVKELAGGEKVALDLSKNTLNINNQAFPPTGTIKLDTKGLVYLAFKTAYGQNIAKSTNGLYEHRAIIGNTIKYTTADESTEVLSGGIYRGDVNDYAPGMEERGDKDVMMKAYTQFLNKVKYGANRHGPEAHELTGIDKEIASKKHDLEEKYGIEGIGSTDELGMLHSGVRRLGDLLGDQGNEMFGRLKPTKQEVLSALSFMDKALSKYPLELLKKEPIEAIMIAKDLNDKNIKLRRRGYYIKGSGDLITVDTLMMQQNPAEMEYLLHHELAHHLEKNRATSTEQERFKKLGSTYLGDKRADSKDTIGFASQYGTYSYDEDFAEILSALMTGGQKRQELLNKAATEANLKTPLGNVLKQKIALVKEFFARRCADAGKNIDTNFRN